MTFCDLRKSFVGDLDVPIDSKSMCVTSWNFTRSEVRSCDLGMRHRLFQFSYYFIEALSL